MPVVGYSVIESKQRPHREPYGCSGAMHVQEGLQAGWSPADEHEGCLSPVGVWAWRLAVAPYEKVTRLSTGHDLVRSAGQFGRARHWPNLDSVTGGANAWRTLDLSYVRHCGCKAALSESQGRNVQ
jgi:hypothetical protein